MSQRTLKKQEAINVIYPLIVQNKISPPPKKHCKFPAIYFYFNHPVLGLGEFPNIPFTKYYFSHPILFKVNTIFTI